MYRARFRLVREKHGRTPDTARQLVLVRSAGAILQDESRQQVIFSRFPATLLLWQGARVHKYTACAVAFNLFLCGLGEAVQVQLAFPPSLAMRCAIRRLASCAVCARTCDGRSLAGGDAPPPALCMAPADCLGIFPVTQVVICVQERAAECCSQMVRSPSHACACRALRCVVGMWYSSWC